LSCPKALSHESSCGSITAGGGCALWPWEADATGLEAAAAFGETEGDEVLESGAEFSGGDGGSDIGVGDEVGGFVEDGGGLAAFELSEVDEMIEGAADGVVSHGDEDIAVVGEIEGGIEEGFGVAGDGGEVEEAGAGAAFGEAVCDEVLEAGLDGSCVDGEPDGGVGVEIEAFIEKG
jgi:hypothetical protein